MNSSRMQCYHLFKNTEMILSNIGFINNTEKNTIFKYLFTGISVPFLYFIA